MVKVKNKLLVALSLMLCAVLLSAVMVFVSDNKNSQKVNADSTIENPTEPGYYELNSDGSKWECNMDWTQFKANHVTITDGHLKVTNTSDKTISGFLVWGDMDSNDPVITDMSSAFAWVSPESDKYMRITGQSLTGLDLRKLDTSSDRKSTRLNSSHSDRTRMPSSA